MIAWHRPHLPRLCEPSAAPIRVFDTPRQDVVTLDPGERAGMYVCGITPYDATHMGHAATYVTFDLLNRVLRDAGHEVTYVQNVTDVDDPLLERAARDGVEWTDLAAAEIQLFRDDMTALRVLPPEYYLGVVESIADIEAAVSRLVDSGATYALPVTDGTAANATDAGAGPGDVYLDLTRQPSFGQVCGWSREQMLEVYADRGGDPDRPGKRDPLDPLLWRAARTGEPSWPSARLGDGRPGWHIECTAIAVKRLGVPFDVQGGGTDLVFPHHEMSAVQAGALAGAGEFAQAYVHQAMVGLHGQKMSKSRGNLVLVSRLRAQGEDPMAMRLALLAQHYRTPWDWHDELLEAARERLGHWRRACAAAAGPPAEDLITWVRRRLADDLDAPGALHVVDDWAQATENGHGADTSAPAQVAEVLDALLGVRI